jgi:hypothetical protein
MDSVSANAIRETRHAHLLDFGTFQRLVSHCAALCCKAPETCHISPLCPPENWPGAGQKSNGCTSGLEHHDTPRFERLSMKCETCLSCISVGLKFKPDNFTGSQNFEVHHGSKGQYA